MNSLKIIEFIHKNEEELIGSKDKFIEEPYIENN